VRTPSITRFYQVQLGSEWARFWVTDDGCLSIMSDFGNYGYWWGGPGCEFRAFLARERHGDTGYILGKLAGGKQHFYAEDTERKIKRRILEWRREGALSKEKARKEWELVCLGIGDEHDAVRWYDRTELQDAYDLTSYGPPRQLVAFMDRLWPLFVDALRAELAAESVTALPPERGTP